MNLRVAVSRADRRDLFARAIAPALLPIVADDQDRIPTRFAVDVYAIADELVNEGGRLYARDVEERTDPPGPAAQLHAASAAGLAIGPLTRARQTLQELQNRWASLDYAEDLDPVLESVELALTMLRGAP